MNSAYLLHGLRWNTVRMRAVDVATAIDRRTHDGAMSLIDNLRRANDGGNAVKRRAETMAAEMAEATRARNAARAEARAAEDARIHAAGKAAVAVAAARARQAAEAAAPGLSRQPGQKPRLGQPSKPKRRGRGPKRRGMGF